MFLLYSIFLGYILIIVYLISTIKKNPTLTPVQKNNYTFLIIAFPFLGIILYNFRNRSR